MPCLSVGGCRRGARGFHERRSCNRRTTCRTRGKRGVGFHWRSIALELVTIIAGVLIALAADRLVRDFDARNDAAEARANLRVEIGDESRADPVSPGCTGLRAAPARRDRRLSRRYTRRSAPAPAHLDRAAAYLDHAGCALASRGQRRERLAAGARRAGAICLRLCRDPGIRPPRGAGAGRLGAAARPLRVAHHFRRRGRLHGRGAPAGALCAWLLSVSGGQTRDAARRVGAEPILNELRGPQSVCLPARFRSTKRSAASAPDAWSSRDKNREGAQHTVTVTDPPGVSPSRRGGCKSRKCFESVRAGVFGAVVRVVSKTFCTYPPNRGLTGHTQ